MALNWDSNRRRSQLDRDATVVKGAKARPELPPTPRNLARRPIPQPPMRRIKK